MRVAVLGTGRMGLRHMQVVRGLGWELVGIHDRHGAALAKAAEEFRIPADRCFHEPSRLMEKAQPECVVVATTAPGHAPLTGLAVEYGARYVLCEKPMASSLCECDAMIATCERHGTRLAINHQTRFAAQYLEAKRILNSEAFGSWTSIAVVAGNMGLAMNGVHYFELLRWLSGEPPAEVTAWLTADPAPNARGPQFQDMAGAVRVTTKGGKRLYMDFGADQGHGIRAVYAGGAGMLVADELAGRMQLSMRQAECRALPTSRYGLDSQDATFEVPPADVLAPTRAVLEALVAGRDYPTGEEGRTAMATLVAAHVSNERGHQAVRVADGLPRELRLPFP